MIHNIKRYLLTLVALLAMTTGAWAQQTTVTWDTETWASGWTSDVKTHTVDGVTITVTGDADAENYEGNLYIYVDNSASNTLTFSSDIPIARIEMTKKTASSSLNVSPLDGWSLSSDNTTVIWEGTATKSLVCKTCTLTVSKIKFFLEEPLMTLNDTKTVATMAKMPASDVTVSYELVRDMQDATYPVVFSSIPTEALLVKKNPEGKYKYQGSLDFKLNDPLITGDANAQNIIDHSTDVTVSVLKAVKTDADPGYTFDNATSQTLNEFRDDTQPGTYKIVAAGADKGGYDGKVESAVFTVVEANDLMLSGNPEMLSKVSITVGGTAATVSEGNVIKNVEPGKKVVMKTANTDYIIRKATVKKNGTAQ